MSHEPIDRYTLRTPRENAKIEDHHRKQREAQQAKLAADWERFKDKVRADVEAETDAKAAELAELAGLSPEQRVERELQRQSHAQIPGNYPRRPDGWTMALQEIRAEQVEAEQRERKAREDALGLPERQAQWQAAQDAITATRQAAEREAAEICRASEQAAQERAQDELDALGPYPTIDDLEKVTA